MLSRHDQGEFRPLVERAWRSACALTGCDPRDRVARETWYRDQISTSTAGRTTSTKDVDRQEFRAIVRRFSMLSMSDVPDLRGLSVKQCGVLRPLVDAAWRDVCARRSAPVGATFSTWYDAELESVGVFGRCLPNKVGSFDDVLSHFAVIAGDRFWITRTAQASERRLRYLIARSLDALSVLTGQPHTWAYVRGIFDQMRLPEFMDSAPAAVLFKLFQALDTHHRRLLRDSSNASSNPVFDPSGAVSVAQKSESAQAIAI